MTQQLHWLPFTVTIHPLIHGFSACRYAISLTFSLGEFLGYWNWLWNPGLSSVLVSIVFPFAVLISVISHFLFLTWHCVSFVYFSLRGIYTQPQTHLLFSSLDRHMATADPETELRSFTNRLHSKFFSSFLSLNSVLLLNKFAITSDPLYISASSLRRLHSSQRHDLFMPRVRAINGRN